jgi:hypothetical protein
MAARPHESGDPVATASRYNSRRDVHGIAASGISQDWRPQPWWQRTSAPDIGPLPRPMMC